MKLKIIFIIFILAGNCWGKNLLNSKITFKDPWLGKDKADHLLVSAFLTAGSFYYLKEELNFSQDKSLLYSAGFSLSLGVVKEIRDSFQQTNAASVKDLLADLVGIGLGIFLFNLN